MDGEYEVYPSDEYQYNLFIVWESNKAKLKNLEYAFRDCKGKSVNLEHLAKQFQIEFKCQYKALDVNIYEPSIANSVQGLKDELQLRQGLDTKWTVAFKNRFFSTESLVYKTMLAVVFQNNPELITIPGFYEQFLHIPAKVDISSLPNPSQAGIFWTAGEALAKRDIWQLLEKDGTLKEIIDS